MKPTLFYIGPMPIHSYGFLLAVSFILGIWLVTRRAAACGITQEIVNDLAVIFLIAGVVGSILAYVIVHRKEFENNLFAIINPVQPDGTFGISGLILLGGVIPAILAGYIYAKIKRIPVLLTLDAAAPALPLGIAFTRIGCFLNGCCYGKPTDRPFPLGFDFSPYHCAAGFEQVYLHAKALIPTQLWESMDMWIVFGLLLFLDRFKRFAGHTVLLMLILYSIHRFIIDFFRIYIDTTYHAFGLTHNQYIAIIIWLTCIPAWIYFFRKSRPAALSP